MSQPPVVGVLGGTFDPVHLGHLALATATRRALRLERVLLLPTAVPPHKSVPRLTAERHREAMLRLAIDGLDGLGISTLELETAGVCYTIDTLRRLREGPPSCRPLFVMGGDSLLDLHTWRDYRALLREFDLVVLDRPGALLLDLLQQIEPWIREAIREVPEEGIDTEAPEAELPGRGGRIFHIPIRPLAVSSTEIRRRAAEGRSLDGLVPDSVARYIRRNSLYRQEDQR